MAKGKKTGGGSRAGVPNKATADIRALARPYGPAAVAALAELAGLIEGKPAAKEATRCMALKELLDRGYGKARQPLSGPDEDDAAQPLQVVYRWMAAGEVPTAEA